MSAIPQDLRYARSHEWLREESGGGFTLGITEFAQEQLGDIVFVELPESGAHFDAGAECAVIESVKAAADVYLPVAGTISAVNTALADAPETINESPYEAGWLLRLTPDAAAAAEVMLDAAAYAAHIDDA